MEEKPACACYHLEEGVITDPELAWCEEHHGDYGKLICELKRMSRRWRLDELRCVREAGRLKERGESMRALIWERAAFIYGLAWTSVEGALVLAPNKTKCEKRRGI